MFDYSPMKSPFKNVESLIPYPVALAWSVVSTLLLLCSIMLVAVQLPQRCAQCDCDLALRIADGGRTGGGVAAQSCSDWISTSRVTPVVQSDGGGSSSRQNSVEDAWAFTKWTPRVSPCLVAGLPIEELDAHLNFRRGWTLGFVDDVEDKTQILPFLRANMDPSLHRRKRRVLIDLGANEFETSVTWFLRMYPLDFTEIHAVEVQTDLFQKPSTPPLEVPAFEINSQSRLRPFGRGPAGFPAWLMDRVHPYNFFISSQDNQEELAYPRSPVHLPSPPTPLPLFLIRGVDMSQSFFFWAYSFSFFPPPPIPPYPTRFPPFSLRFPLPFLLPNAPRLSHPTYSSLLPFLLSPFPVFLPPPFHTPFVTPPFLPPFQTSPFPPHFLNPPLLNSFLSPPFSPCTLFFPQKSPLSSHPFRLQPSFPPSVRSSLPLLSPLRTHLHCIILHPGWLRATTSPPSLPSPAHLPCIIFFHGPRTPPPFPPHPHSHPQSMVNVTRWLLDELQLTEEDTVIIKMDIEGTEWAVLHEWLAIPHMPAIVDELFVEVHYHHPSMEAFTWTPEKFNRTLDETTQLLTDLRRAGFYVHPWP
ncbi:unnamed protein product [Closterium sp. Naga37s-1]|nr:unnamed protein product [Closterium sp. Naga37s-1]